MLRKKSMQLSIYRVNNLTGSTKKCTIYVHKKIDIPRRNPDIYHCGDASGEVPPVLIPNTEVKLTRAENT